MPNQNIIVIISSCHNNFHYPKIWNPSFSNLSESPISIRYVIVVICSNFVKFYWIYRSLAHRCPPNSIEFYRFPSHRDKQVDNHNILNFTCKPGSKVQVKLDPEFSEKMTAYFSWLIVGRSKIVLSFSGWMNWFGAIFHRHADHRHINFSLSHWPWGSFMHMEIFCTFVVCWLLPRDILNRTFHYSFNDQSSICINKRVCPD